MRNMRFWFDTEFYENGRTIDLISIGVVCEDDSEFYTEVKDFDFSKTDHWIQKNVEPFMTGKSMERSEIGRSLYEFIITKTSRPEFWAYYADYDWVVFCQLFGRMIDLPVGFPMYCNDLKQEMNRLRLTNPPIKNAQEHNALADAKWAKDVHIWMEKNNGS